MIRRGSKRLVLAPAFFVWVLVFACQAQAQSNRAAMDPSGVVSMAGSFDVQIEAPADVQDLLQRHLELMRYRALTDLDDQELERLRGAAEPDARALLGTLGYFSPTLDVLLQPGNTTATSRRRVTIHVQPGPPTVVRTVTIDYSGAITSSPDAAQQRATIRSTWSLPAGTRFTQTRWDEAKALALRQLGAQHFPLGQIQFSQADINPDTRSANLHLVLDSGPAYRLGALQVLGLERYDAELVARIARLRPGTVYDQSGLLEAQQRLQDSGYFDSVYVTVQTEGDPGQAPVLVTVRETRRNKLVFGIGASTDSGARLSVEHTNHQIPGLGWRAVSKLLLDRNNQLLGTTLTSTPGEGSWRWVTSALWKNDNAAGVDLQSQNLRVGRNKSADRIDRNYFVDYDRSRTTDTGAVTRAQSISLNYAWTQRDFDNLLFPSNGHGLGVELGGGVTLGGQRAPYLRTQLQWLGVWPLQPRAGRIVARAQAGAVLARGGAVLPSTQLFLTGGDSSVRGYAYHAIGATSATGQTTPGRYLANGSVEWQRPIFGNGLATDWEGTLFVDAGSVADKPAAFKARVGIGAGARWKSPVGPLQMDLAYGVAVKRVRLHLSVGFTF